jgi:hypothetical protein
MKWLHYPALFILLIGIIFISGCAGTAPQGPAATPSGPGGAQSGMTVQTTAPLVMATTPVSSGRVILDERISLQSGYQTAYQKYAFEDYGYQYLYPDDTFSISVNSDKPVNVLVIDKDGEIKFPTVEPEWNTILKKNQWDYSPVVPVFIQSNVLKKDMTFTIKQKSMYFLIIDPRFSSEQAGWHGIKHEEVHIDVKVAKL